MMTMMMFSFLHKLSSEYSIARWLLTRGLIRFLHPSDDQLKQMMAGDGKLTRKDSKSRHRNNKHHQNNHHHHQNNHQHQNNRREAAREFKVPKNTEFVLEACRIRPNDLSDLKYYNECRWLIDFGFCATVVFVATELFNYFLPKSTEDLNLSLVWCVLVLGFALKWLLTLTMLYFQGDESMGERSVCLVSSGLFFLVAMMVLITDENFLEFGLNPAYESFNESAYKLLDSQGVSNNATGPMSKLIFKLSLAFWSGIIGGLFAFPGLRFAQMHKDSIAASSKSRLSWFFLQLSFISPLFIVLLWIRPLARGYLTERDWPSRGILMSTGTFETIRILVIILVISVRVSLIWKYLQAYLNLAPSKLARLRKEAGRITNIELQRMIARVYYYLCVVTLQLLSPLLIILFTTFLFKVLGNYSWTGVQLSDTDGAYSNIKVNNSSLKSVFTPILFRGILGYITWWTSTVWFVTSIIGFTYHSYFTPVVSPTSSM